MGPIADEDLTIRLRAIGGERTEHDIREVRRELERLDRSSGSARASVRGLGNESEGTARKLSGLFGGGGRGRGLDTRLSLGPFSTSLKFAIPLIGTAARLLPGVVTGILGLAEATGTAALGGGAAGGVGLLALGQAMGTVTLASHGLSDALGGNLDAYMRLTPAQQQFVGQLQTMEPLLTRLQNTAARGLLPGVGAGLQAASRNFPVVRRIVGGTSRALGGLAQQAGEQVGSEAFGRDLGTLGRSNIRIIRDLGQAGLSLADAARHILVEAAPLAEWLARQAREGARLIDVWAGNARAGGDLRRFFRGAREDLALFWSITSHVARGIANIFQSSDVDGTRTLRRIDRISRRFETWTRSINGRGGLAKAIEDAIPDLVGPLAEMIARGFILGWQKAVSLLWQAFWRADLGGKFSIIFLGALKFGLFRKAGVSMAEWMLGGMSGRMKRNAAEDLADAVGTSVNSRSGRFARIGRIIGRTMGVAMGIALATWAISEALDRLGNSAPADALFQSVTGNPRADANPRVASTRENLARPSTRRSIRAYERRYGNVLDRFGTSWSPQELAFLRRTHYPGLTPGTRGAPRAHLDAVMGDDRGMPRLRSRPPDIVVHSHVHTSDREIGKATGRHTWREDDRR